jgi:hypothetical protein
MKTLPIFFLLTLLTCSAMIAQAQAPFNPATVEAINFTTTEDYLKHEAIVIEAAKWLESTPPDENDAMRKKVNAFVIKYLSGSPNVTLTLDVAITDLFDENAHLLVLYMASYSRYCLEHKGSANRQSATKAGLLSTINVYKKGIGISRDKNLAKLTKMTDAELDQYITDKLLKEQ